MPGQLQSKLAKAAVGTALLAVFATASPVAQASAAMRSAGHRVAAGPAGIGFGNGVSSPRAMVAAPAASAPYVGTAQPGDDLADACYIWSGGQKWQLVLDRNGEVGDHYPATAGFLPQAVLTSDPVNGAPCPPSFNTGDSTGQGSSTMYSAPHFGTYAVAVVPGRDVLFDLCAVTVGGTPWIWVLDTSGEAGDHWADTTGFLPYSELVNAVSVINTPC